MLIRVFIAQYILLSTKTNVGSYMSELTQLLIAIAAVLGALASLIIAIKTKKSE